MGTVTVDYYGMSGTGRTVTEAKKDAGAKVTRALGGYYTPTVVAHRGYAILVYREPTGWNTRIIVCPQDGIREGKVWGSGDHATEGEAIRAAQCHIADLGWCESDGLDAPEFIKDKGDRAEFRYKAEFQIRYRKAKAVGLTDTQCHHYAGRAPGLDIAKWERLVAGELEPVAVGAPGAGESFGDAPDTCGMEGSETDVVGGL
jgi:hypothetical protein